MKVVYTDDASEDLDRITKPEITISSPVTDGRSAEMATALDMLFASGRSVTKTCCPRVKAVVTSIGTFTVPIR
jgi:hypothetical protein